MKFSIILVLLQVFWCFSVSGSDPPPKSALDFMKQYGYLKADKITSAALYTEDGLSEVIRTVQRFGALEETGQLDNATLKLMRAPRCGNADIIQEKRSKRFVLTSGWNKRHLTYYVANWSSKLGEQVVARLIGKALNTWGSYANLKFSRATNPDADIIVSFARGAHNDPFPFDGPGYVLAHAYFPNSGSAISGDIHFDDDENWVHEDRQAVEEGGTDFYSVALHELGHSLGLGHSNDPRSVMFPYYQGGDETTLQLGQDDILAMYQLYIARTIQETSAQTTTEQARRKRPTNTRPTNRPTTKPEAENPRTRTPYLPTSTRAPYETPRTRTPQLPTSTEDPHETPRTGTSQSSIWTSTSQQYSTLHKTKQNNKKKWESSTPSIQTSTYRTTYRGGIDVHPPSRDRTTYIPHMETRTTLTTFAPSTLYPKMNEEGTTYSRWFTSRTPLRKDNTLRTSTMNQRFPSSEITTERYRHRTSVIINKTPYYSSTRYPIGSQSSTPPPEPNICEGNFDSVANLRNEIFIFKDEYIWRLHDRNRVVSGYPVLLRHMFPYLPENIKKIDAAYQRPDGNMILFTEDLYWVYDGSQFIENSPKPILDYGIPMGIGGIDAVITWSRNGKTYLFKEDRFWRFNEESKSPDLGYPQIIDKWRGIPRNLDAAMTWKDGQTYFFKNKLYWILDNYRIEATSDSPRYATREWLRCP